MTEKKITPRLVKLNTGEQIICIIHVKKGSEFIRLETPYKIELHQYDILGDYVMEEKMSMKPWIFNSKDEMFSVHKNHVVTLAVPSDHISEYYINLKKGYLKIPTPEELAKKRQENYDRLINKLQGSSEEEEYTTADLIKKDGGETIH